MVVVLRPMTMVMMTMFGRLMLVNMNVGWFILLASHKVNTARTCVI